jgi:hypothetical protein
MPNPIVPVRAYSENREIRGSQVNELLNFPISRLVSILAAILCFLSLVDGAFPQFQMYLLDGHMLVGNVALKAALLSTAALGFVMRPKFQFAGLPMYAWLLCVGFLVADTSHLIFSRGMSIVDVLQSYNAYYLLLLIGPVLSTFRGAVSERLIINCTVVFFLVCAPVGAIQYFTAQPILYTQSADGAFSVQSWYFLGEVRAFSLFSSALEFGIFCALCGGLGVALTRTLPIRGALLFSLSALACFTTLTRLCYLLFLCVSTYALVLTFGKRPRRGLLLPLLYGVLGISTLVIGLGSFTRGEDVKLQDASSLVDRIVQWAYYTDLIAHADLEDQLFGVGIVQNEKILPLYPMAIDNVPLALVLHIGIAGLVFFGILMIKMWLYARRLALATQRPFLIAAASLWATLACAGIFNITFSSFGIVFTLAILCEKGQRHKVEQSDRSARLEQLRSPSLASLKDA